MSFDCINKDPKLFKEWILREKARENECEFKNPDSFVKQFKEELREKGFEFEINNQIMHYMPKYKDTIVPIAVRYYVLAREHKRYNEQNFFLSFFRYKGMDYLIPMLLEDYCSYDCSSIVRWFISDCLYNIRSKKYTSEYIEIVSNESYGRNRQMIVLLIGKLKVEEAIPVLIDLLDDDDVALHAICALGDFKKEEFRPYFERYASCNQPGLRKNAKRSLKKLDSVKKQ